MYNIYGINQDESLDNTSSYYDNDYNLERINYTLESQMIVTPQISSSNNFDTYIIEKGDTLYNIAKKYSTNFKTLQYLNGLEADDYVYPGQKILIPKGNMGIYIVNENETLKEVLKKLGTSADDLLKYNSEIYLYPEQLLFFKKREIS